VAAEDQPGSGNEVAEEVEAEPAVVEEAAFPSPIASFKASFS